MTLLVVSVAAPAHARATPLPLGKANYAMAIGSLDADSTENWVRLAQYTFAGDGKVVQQYWQWSQRVHVPRTSTGITAQDCAGRDCTVLTAAGWETADASQTLRGTYTTKNGTLTINWSNDHDESWKLSTASAGKLAAAELAGNDFDATHGFGNGSNARWTQRIPASVVKAADWTKMKHRYALWKTAYDPDLGYEGYVDQGDGEPFWAREWHICTDKRCLGAKTNASATIHTAYYIAPANAAPAHRRDTLWHWHTELADARGEICYTGNSHVKPMIQVVDDDGRFHGWVGVEASLNQTTQAGPNDDDIGVFHIIG
ncbi:hypothetical protein [Actinomadura rubteroloni]|nr:hypothetical protein [Actinomadura rubteroloni]